MSSLTPTGTGTRAQASLLNLYDQERLKGPWVKATNKLTTWKMQMAKSAASYNKAALSV
jgi:hypothetical protein